MRPKVQGRSLSMLLLLNRDPTWRANCAPFLQYSKEAWRAWTQTGHDGCLSLQRLRYLWERGVTGKNGFSTLISPTGKRRWGRVRGPMGAMLLTLHRLGWSMEDAMTVIDDLGVRRKIYDLSPNAWETQCFRAVHRGLERTIAAKWSRKKDSGCDSVFADRRACVDHLRCFLATGKNALGPREAGVLRLLLTEGLWTNQRLREAGYEVPECCDLCGRKDDFSRDRKRVR